MHPWDVSPKEAIEIQKSLMDHLNLEDDFIAIPQFKFRVAL